MQVGSWISGLALLLFTGCATNHPLTSVTPAAAVAPLTSSGQIAADTASDATIPTMPDRQALKSAVQEAVRRRDFRAALAMEQAWAKQNPDDLEVREDEPFLYRALGDVAGWEHSRDDLTATLARIRRTGPLPAQPGFTIDFFKVAGNLVIVQQCYERAGPAGVLYRFDEMGQGQNLLSFFVVESPDRDNQIARERGKKYPVFFLDHNRPDIHETVEIMLEVPAYPALRKRVIDYIANPQPRSSSAQKGLPNEGCAFAHPGAQP
jgi:hypothetical protein